MAFQAQTDWSLHYRSLRRIPTFVQLMKILSTSISTDSQWWSWPPSLLVSSAYWVYQAPTPKRKTVITSGLTLRGNPIVTKTVTLIFPLQMITLIPKRGKKSLRTTWSMRIFQRTMTVDRGERLRQTHVLTVMKQLPRGWQNPNPQQITVKTMCNSMRVFIPANLHCEIHSSCMTSSWIRHLEFRIYRLCCALSHLANVSDTVFVTFFFCNTQMSRTFQAIQAQRSA